MTNHSADLHLSYLSHHDCLCGFRCLLISFKKEVTYWESMELSVTVWEELHSWKLLICTEIMVIQYSAVQFEDSMLKICSYMHWTLLPSTPVSEISANHSSFVGGGLMKPDGGTERELPPFWTLSRLKGQRCQENSWVHEKLNFYFTPNYTNCCHSIGIAWFLCEVSLF